MIQIAFNRLDIFDSNFRNNRGGYLFDGNWNGYYYLHRCSIDDPDFGSNVFTSEIGESSFKIIFLFIDISPCEGNFDFALLFDQKKEKKNCSFRPYINFISGRYFLFYS